VRLVAVQRGPKATCRDGSGRTKREPPAVEVCASVEKSAPWCRRGSPARGVIEGPSQLRRAPRSLPASARNELLARPTPAPRGTRHTGGGLASPMREPRLSSSEPFTAGRSLRRFPHDLASFSRSRSFSTSCRSPRRCRRSINPTASSPRRFPGQRQHDGLVGHDVGPLERPFSARCRRCRRCIR